MCKAFLPLVPLLGKEASKEVEEGERERNEDNVCWEKKKKKRGEENRRDGSARKNIIITIES